MSPASLSVISIARCTSGRVAASAWMKSPHCSTISALLETLADGATLGEDTRRRDGAFDGVIVGEEIDPRTVWWRLGQIEASSDQH